MARLFLGGLKEGASRTELEREFETFGPLREVWVARKPPGFGFILFENARDADDALREMNGQYVCGGRIRVEYARDSGGGRGGRGGGSGGGGYGGAGGARGGSNECQNCGRYGHSSRDCKKGTSQTYGYNNGGDDRGDYQRDNRGYNGSQRRRSRSYDRDRRQSSRRRRSPSRSRSRSKDRKSRQ